ncbi:MAG: signal peptidase I, partial [Trebonia sp.]
MLLTSALVLLAGAAWFYLAPTAIGGSTSYVVTSGRSMQPLFHTGDLALVRPAGSYRVGEVVAYRSSVLHVVVLHRITAIHNDRYTFKGDNNNFTDPTHPARAALVGRLWLRVPRGGSILNLLHRPLIGALLAGGAGLLLMAGTGKRRRSRRGRRSEHPDGPVRPGARPVTAGHSPSGPTNLRTLLIACAVGAAAFTLLGLIALLHPLRAPATRNVPYTQQVRFGYRADARRGPVYPSGVVSTGDPIFLQLVHRVQIHFRYRLKSAAPATITGSEATALRITGPTGWSRTIPLSSPHPFTGTRAGAAVTLDLPSLQRLLAQVQRQTGVSAGSAYALAVVAEVHVRGRLAGTPIHESFKPALSFQLQPLQLQPGSGSAGTSPGQSSFLPHQRGTVPMATTTAAALGVAGVSITVGTVRWLALAGLLASLGAALLVAVPLRRSRGFDEAARVQAEYGQLIVPIAAGADLGWP